MSPYKPFRKGSLHDPFSDVVYEKILDGFYQSKEVRPKIMKYLQKYCY